MPEGHTLHRLAKLHQRRYAGAPLRVSSPQGRFTADAAIVDGRRLVRAEAYGKHLFHSYDNDCVVHVHLGLYGKFTEGKLPVPAPVGQIRMRLLGETHWADLRGPNTCALIDATARAALIERLGPDPLRTDADPEAGWDRLRRSRISVAGLLMDQRVAAGVGNVYRAEVLFRHGIDPQRPGKALAREEWDTLWSDLVGLMRDGVRKGRIDTVRPEHEPGVNGRPPREDAHGGEVYVYRRHGMPCLICGSTVRKAELAGRNLYWCPTCQPTT